MVYEWLGSVWQVTARGCRSDLDCESPSPAPSEEIELRVAFSDSFVVTMEFGANDTFIGPQRQATTTFRYAEGADVDVELR